LPVETAARLTLKNGNDDLPDHGWLNDRMKSFRKSEILHETVSFQPVVVNENRRFVGIVNRSLLTKP
jgi:hypothetical protein